jgi:hypothetical protein
MTDKKITQLSSATTIDSTDEIPIVQNVSTTPVTRQTSVNTLLNNIPAAGIVLGGDSNLYRSAANTLKTDDSLVVSGSLTLGTSVFPYVPPTNYTPSWTGSATAPVISVNGSLVGRYSVAGKMCHVNIAMTAGSSTTFGTGTWGFSLPIPVANVPFQFMGHAHCRDSGTANYERNVIAQYSVSSGSVSLFVGGNDAANNNNISATVPFTWTTGDALTIDISYEIA